jgi:hypothetical protein
MSSLRYPRAPGALRPRPLGSERVVLLLQYAEEGRGQGGLVDGDVEGEECWGHGARLVAD